MTQGALVLAFLLALLANPGGVIRPSLFLVLLAMLGTVALMVSIHNEFMFGSTFRAFRLSSASRRSCGCSPRGGGGVTSSLCALT